MLSTTQVWTALVMIVNWVHASQDPVIQKARSAVHDTSATDQSSTSTYHSDTTIDSTTTIQVPPPMNSSSTLTSVCYNESVTTTVILSIVSTDWSTSTSTLTTTLTDTTTDTIILTTTDTITNTITDTTTIQVPTTITVPPNPCPTTCSISAGTVNLFYWPTNHPEHIYPSTYVNSHLNYTFTSPSVYMVVDTMYGYNTAGRAGPSGTSLVFPLDLGQVSTVDPANSATRQLTLNDLGTDCPQIEAPSAIATARPNGRCDPVLLAPEPVKSWASPCNACGQFGMFDPPYAVSPLTGGLVPITTTGAMTLPRTQTAPSSIEAGTTATPGSTTTVAVSTEAVSSSMETPSSSNMASPVSSTSALSTSSSVGPASRLPTFNPASRLNGPGGWFGLSYLVLVILL